MPDAEMTNGWGTVIERMPKVIDKLGRPLRDLRLSVIDRCNLRCQYCMPEKEYAWLSRKNILSFEEIVVLVEAFVSNGVNKIRLTGGEPLLREDLCELVRALAAISGVQDLAMTTNGVLLARHAAKLKEAGLRRVTVSLDTLRPETFRRLTQRTSFDAVINGIRVLGDVGFTGTKLDVVVIRGVNDDELADLIEFGRKAAAEVRFIEYMDIGGATGWTPEQVFSRAEILDSVTAAYGSVAPAAKRSDSAPADRFRLPDGTIFGIISSTTQPFCGSCDRSRLTADGVWYRCLYALNGTDLRTPLRAGANVEELTEIIVQGWAMRRDRGAVERLALSERAPLIGITDLKKDPHLEMHTRGG